MTKKSRRARRRAAKRTPAKPYVAPGLAVEERQAPTAAPRATGVDMAGQYDYVYGDLKRIAILAGTMFAILLILSFVIR
jgi:uncharacterized membrane protein